MDDLLAYSIGGAGVGGLLISLVKSLGARQITTLDKTISELGESIKGLAHDIRNLRETDIAQAKDIGALQQSVKDLTTRVDGQGTYYRRELDDHRKVVHDRMTEATHAMLAHGEEMLKASAGGRKR